MNIFKSIIVLVVISAQSYAQGIGINQTSTEKTNRAYTEMSFSIGRGMSLGLNHIKDISPKTSISLGAMYSNYRMHMGRLESNLPTTIVHIRPEIRYFVTPKDHRLTAFLFAAVNNSFYNFPSKFNYSLGLEVGGEVRYKIAENVFFYARTSFYRQNLNSNMNPYLLNYPSE